MRILWDEPKRLANMEKHGLDFASLTTDFLEDAVIIPAKLGRHVAIGSLNGEVIVAVVFRPLGSEAVSVVSMRRASRMERSRL